MCYFFRANVFAWIKPLVTQFYVFLSVWILLCVLSQGWGLSIWMRCSAQVMSALCGTATIKTSQLRTANTLKTLQFAVMFHIWAMRKRSEQHTHTHTHNISSYVLIFEHIGRMSFGVSSDSILHSFASIACFSIQEEHSNDQMNYIYSWCCAQYSFWLKMDDWKYWVSLSVSRNNYWN